METITYKEATKLIHRSMTGIVEAASKGTLTKVPRAGQKVLLSKEQVLLFKGKQIRLTMLSHEEMNTWMQIKQEIEREVPQGVNPTKTPLSRYLDQAFSKEPLLT